MLLYVILSIILNNSLQTLQEILCYILFPSLKEIFLCVFRLQELWLNFWFFDLSLYEYFSLFVKVLEDPNNSELIKHLTSDCLWLTIWLLFQQPRCIIRLEMQTAMFGCDVKNLESVSFATNSKEVFVILSVQSFFHNRNMASIFLLYKKN